MRLTLTSEEFLALWRLRRGLEPLRNDCRIVRTDGVDLSELERSEMESWFALQLRQAPADRLAPVDIAASVSVGREPDGAGIVELPDGVVRVVAVDMDGWARTARIISDPADPLCAAQLNPFSRGGANAPVAVAEPGRLRLYTPQPGAALTRLSVIMEPMDAFYTFDSSLLDLIPKLTDRL